MKKNDKKIIHFMNDIESGRIIFNEKSGMFYYTMKGLRLAKAKCNNGYLTLTTTVQGKDYLAYQQRVAYACYNGISTLDPELDVNHKDGIKTNNMRSNLELVSKSENQLHKFRIGLDSNVGVKNSRSKLLESDVVKIKELLKLNVKQVDIAEMFGLHPRYVSLIKSGRRWSHVKI